MARTVQEVIEAIVAAVPGAPFPETVDTMKVGDPHVPDADTWTRNCSYAATP